MADGSSEARCGELSCHSSASELPGEEDRRRLGDGWLTHLPTRPESWQLPMLVTCGTASGGQGPGSVPAESGSCVAVQSGLGLAVEQDRQHKRLYAHEHHV